MSHFPYIIFRVNSSQLQFPPVSFPDPRGIACAELHHVALFAFAVNTALLSFVQPRRRAAQRMFRPSSEALRYSCTYLSHVFRWEAATFPSNTRKNAN